MLAYGWNLIDGFNVVYLVILHGGLIQGENCVQKLSAIKI